MNPTVFQDLVSETFEYLVSIHGYHIVMRNSSEYLLRYRKDRVSINFTYDANRSFELFVYFEFVFQSGEVDNFSLSDILKASGIGDFHDPQVSQETKMKVSLQKVLVYLTKVPEKYLIGNESQYRLLLEKRSKWSDAYQLEIDLQSVRSEVEVLWGMKEYGKVASLLQPFKKYLSKAELLKLAYARKKAGV